MTTSVLATLSNICELRDAGDGSLEIELIASLSLVALRDSDIGAQLMRVQDWYNAQSWSAKPVPAGTYRIRLPIPGSNGKMFHEQCQMLTEGEKPILIVLAALALLCVRKAGHPDPLNGG